MEQETLHYDPQSGSLTSLRSKEEAHDYRYFPEPDLVPVAPTEEMLKRAREALPELPAARAERLERELELPAETARCSRSARSWATSSRRRSRPRTATRSNVANWITNELAARIGDGDPAATALEPAALRGAGGAGRRRSRSRRARARGARRAAGRGRQPRGRGRAKGLGRAESGELESIVDQAIADNPDAVEKIRAGKGQAIGAIVGAVMRETKGRADGGEVQRMIRERIGA